MSIHRHFGDLDQADKTMDLGFTKPDIETPSGLKARPLSSSIYKSNLSKLYTSPVETIFCSDTKQSMYCQLLVGLIQRDKVTTFGSAYASTVLRAIKFLEDYW